MKTRGAFLRTWAIALGAFLIAVASFNAVVDPYRYFGVEVAGINDKKPRPDVQLTTIKRATVARVQANAVILGNSRADIGFDPENPLWARHALSAVNLAVPGAGMVTTLANLE